MSGTRHSVLKRLRETKDEAAHTFLRRTSTLTTFHKDEQDDDPGPPPLSDPVPLDATPPSSLFPSSSSSSSLPPPSPPTPVCQNSMPPALLPVSVDESFPSTPSPSQNKNKFKNKNKNKKPEETEIEEEDIMLTVEQEITAEAGRVKQTRQPTLFGVGVRVGIVVLILFLCGFCGFSFLYVIVFATLVLCDGFRKDHYQKIKDDFTTQRRAHDINHLKMVLEEVPPWVNLTQKERVEWLNVVLETLWPYMKEATEQTLKSSLSAVLEQYKPEFLSTLAFERLNLGDTPPLIQYIDTALKDDNEEELGDEQIHLDISLRLAGDNDICVAAGGKGVTIHTTLEDLEVRGTMRVILAPVSTSFPCFKALSFCFISKPTISFRLAAGKVPLMAIPGFPDWFTEFINESLAFYLVWPKKYTYELTKLTDKERRISKDISAAGIAWLEIIGAKDLKNIEKIGVIDPYCVLSLGNTIIETPMCKNDTNPVWRFKTQLLIHDPENEIIQFEVFDKDDIKKDVKLESTELELSLVHQDTGKPLFFNLKLKKQGTLQVRITFNRFFRFREIYPKLDDGGDVWENEFSNRVAFINVIGCENLPYDDAFVEVTYDQALPPTQKTNQTFAASNCNPVFEHTFAFNLPRQALGTKIDFHVRRSTKKALISSVSYKLPETLEPFGADGREIRLPLKGCEGTLCVHFLIKAVLSEKEKEKEVAKMDTKRAEKEELYDKVFDLRSSLSSKTVVALESISAFTAAYLGGSISFSLSPAFGFVIAGIAFGMKYFFSFSRATTRYELQQSTMEDLAMATFDRSVLDKEMVRSQSKALPEWVSDPTIEKNEWINELFIALWPCLRIAIRKSILASMEPLLQEYKPGFLDAIIVHQMGMGSTAPLVTGIRAFPRNKVGQIAVLDLDMGWASDFFLTFHLFWKGFKLPITVSDLSFKGVVRVKFHDLVEIYPCFKNVSISFHEPPAVDFSLSVGGLPIMSLPNASSFLKDLSEDTIQDMIVWPNELKINILDNSEQNESKMATKGTGILRVNVIRAKGVRNVDTFGKSDPYTILYIHDTDSPQKAQTAVIDDSLDPEWHEYFEFIVQKHSFDIDFKLFDEDVGKDDLLGDVAINTSKLPENIPVDIHLPVKFKGKEKGQFFCSIEYKPFASGKGETPSGQLDDDHEWSDSALSVFVTKCVGLPTAQNFYICVDFGGKKQEAKSKKKSMNPSFDSTHHFPFKMSEMKNDKITITLKYRDGDIPVQSKEKEMGSLAIKAADVVQEDFNGEYPLAGGIGVSGKIIVCVTARRVSGRVHSPISWEQAPVFFAEQEGKKEKEGGGKEKEKKGEKEEEKGKEGEGKGGGEGEEFAEIVFNVDGAHQERGSGKKEREHGGKKLKKEKSWLGKKEKGKKTSSKHHSSKRKTVGKGEKGLLS